MHAHSVELPIWFLKGFPGWGSGSGLQLVPKIHGGTGEVGKSQTMKAHLGSLFLKLSLANLRPARTQPSHCKVSLGRPGGWSWDEQLSPSLQGGGSSARACHDRPRAVSQVQELSPGPAGWKTATQLQARRSTQLGNGLYHPEARGNLFTHWGWPWS